MQRFKFIDFTVIQEEREEEEEHGQNVEITFFKYFAHITSQHNQYLYSGYF